MYRDVVAVAKSLHRFSMALPTFRLASLLGRFSGQMTKVFAECRGLEGSDFCVRLDNDLWCADLRARQLRVPRRSSTRVRRQRRALRGPRCSSARHVPRHPLVLSPARLAGRARRQSTRSRFAEKLDICQSIYREYQESGTDAEEGGKRQ